MPARNESQISSGARQQQDERRPLLPAQDDPVHDQVADVESHVAQRGTTPLPWRKLSILLGMRLAEPISFTVIFPFVNSMVFDIGATDDKAKVGFYAGIIESLFAFSQCCTILFWGSLSDRIGRKPVLLSGLFGVACSAFLFGLSRTFVSAVFARALAGATNGNVAIVKSVVGEITDSSNQARAFSFLPLIWSIGCLIGPLLGGYLSKPAEQYPDTFGHGGPLAFNGFWETYPYFLPCATSACLTLSSLLLGTFCLEETLPSKVREKQLRAEAAEDAAAEAGGRETSSTAQPSGRYGSTQQSQSLSSTAGLRPATLRKTRGRSTARVLAHVQSWTSGFTPSGSPDHSRAASREASPSRQAAGGHQESSNQPQTDGDATKSDEPSGVFYLLSTAQIQRVLLSYACLSFIAVALDAVLVLYLFEPIELGGLNFDTEHIGLLLSLAGFGGIVVQLLIFPPLQRRIGSLKVYQLSMWAFPFSVALLPLANIVARLGLAAMQQPDVVTLGEDGRVRGTDLPPPYTALVWTAVLLSSASKVVGSMAFSSNIILVNQCSWLARGAALGTLNSLAQMSASVTRAIGPYAASTLFALSVTKNLLGGHFVWLVLFAAGMLGALSCLLIRDLEKERQQDPTLLTSASAR